MQSIDPDYWRKRSSELGLERGDILMQIQANLDQRYPGKTRALSLNNGVLRLTTPSAPLAAELRLSQVELIKDFKSLGAEFERLSITIAPTH